MTTATYPNIRPALIGKTRTSVPGYVVSDGFPRVEVISNDNPVEWSFRLAFKRPDAKTFKEWVDANYFRWFDMPIRTEQGLIVHRVHFTDNGMPQLTSTIGDVYMYSATVVCRAMERLYNETEIAEIYAAYSEWDVRALDLAINEEWPV